MKCDKLMADGWCQLHHNFFGDEEEKKLTADKNNNGCVIPVNCK